jgi:signal peptidase II
MLGELLFPAGAVLALDQTSKTLVRARVDQAKRSRFSAQMRPRLRPVLNRTIGLGLIHHRHVLVILWGFTVVGTILLILYAPAFQKLTPGVGLSAALGGATSNLIDWLRRGSVIDFIDLRIWPIFNLADASIVLGVGVALWSLW